MQDNVLSNTTDQTLSSNAISTVADEPLWLKNFVRVYQDLSTDNLELLETIYHNHVTFTDPIHKIEGFDNLYRYFESLYQNLVSCEFIIEHVITQNCHAAIYWKMTYQHAKLNQGKVVSIVGNSHIKGEGDKVFYQKDYLDLGAMLYEQIPILGKMILWIKTKAAK
jgi:predicted double-glycine peptidase